MNARTIPVEGRIWLPCDEGFNQAAKAWNLTVDQPVAAVVEAADAEDAAALVRYAAGSGLTVAVQPHGHGASGDVEGVILLRTGRLDALEIRPEERVARVGAGVAWGRVLSGAGPHGLTGLAGTAPGVGVTGYTLGGGLSWFSRKYGVAAGAVRFFEVIGADGRRATVTAGSDPDLFWALRGGGGDFALVTAVEFDLFPAPVLYGGRVMWPDEKAPEVFQTFREITAEAPDELAVTFHRVRIPEAPPMVAVDAAYLGDAAKAAGLLSRFDKIDGMLDDKRGVLPIASLGDIAAEPTDPSPAAARSRLLTRLDDAAAEILLAEPIDPMLAVQVRHLGGALAGPVSEPGATGAIAEPYLLTLVGLGLPQIAPAVKDKQTALLAVLADHVGVRRPYTFLTPGERATDAFDGPTLARLREIKRARDPHKVFRANFPVDG